MNIRYKLNVYEKLLLLVLANSIKRRSKKELSILNGCCTEKVEKTVEMLELKKLIEVDRTYKPHKYTVDKKIYKRLQGKYIDIINLTNLGTYEKYIFITILSLNKNCSYKEIAKRVGCCRRTVINNVKSLQNKGYLVKDVKKIGPKSYRKNNYFILDEFKQQENTKKGSESNKDYNRYDTPLTENNIYNSEFHSLDTNNISITNLLKGISDSLVHLISKITTVLEFIVDIKGNIELVKNPSINLSKYNTTNTGSESYTHNNSSMFSQYNSTKKEPTKYELNQYTNLVSLIKGYKYEPEVEKTIINAIDTLFYSDSILNHSTPIIRKNMSRINRNVLDKALSNFKRQSKVGLIQNTNKYLATCFYQAILNQASDKFYIKAKLETV